MSEWFEVLECRCERAWSNASSEMGHPAQNSEEHPRLHRKPYLQDLSGLLYRYKADYEVTIPW